MNIQQTTDLKRSAANVSQHNIGIVQSVYNVHKHTNLPSPTSL